MKTHTIEEKLLLAILVVQTLLICAGVLSRYAFAWSIAFTEEFTRYLLIWLACVGTPVCLARGEQIRFQWPARFQHRIPRLRRGVGALAVLFFTALLLYSSLQMIRLQVEYKQTTSVMGWTIVWVSAALPIFCGLYFYRWAFSKK